MLDGHLRREIQAKKGEKIPVVVVDWPEEKERRFLASFDRTGAMAEEEEATLARLLSAVDDPTTIPGFDDDEVAGLLRQLDGGGAAGSRKPIVMRLPTSQGLRP